MKKIFTILSLAVLMVALMGTAVLAAGESVQAISANGVENSEAVTSTNVFGDQFRKMFTFNKEKKAGLSLRIAEKRMLRAGQLSEQGKQTEALKFMDKHKSSLQEAEKYAGEASEVDDGEASIKKAYTVSLAIQEKIQIHEERAFQIKAKILERKSGTMTQEQYQHLEEIFSRAQERAESANERVLQRQETLRAQYKIATGVSDEEVEEFFNGLEEKYAQLREQRQTRIQNYLQNGEAVETEIQQRTQSGEASGVTQSLSGGSSGNQQGQIILN